MQEAYRGKGIVILCKDVGATTTVVTFASKGLPPAPVPRSEFHDVLAAMTANGSCSINVVTVVDEDRRFYIDGNTETISSEVNRLLEQTGTTRTITIGLSMGGFASVAYARRLTACDTAIAFGAHSSVHPNIVPLDNRSPELRARIRTFDVADCLAELDDKISYRLFYGETDPEDRVHADRFAAARHPDMLIEFVSGCDHNVVAFWAYRGELAARLSRLLGTQGASAEADELAVPAPFADLHLVVDGMRIEAVWKAMVGRFIVPAGAAEVALVSQTARPSDVMGSDDRRELGVCLSGLAVIDGFSREDRIGLDDPRLAAGFHGLEKGCRWTSGRATLRSDLVESYPDGFFLRVELAAPSICWPLRRRAATS